MKLTLAAALLAFSGLAAAADAPAKPPCENFAWPMAREVAAFAAPGAAVTSGTTLETWPNGATPVTLAPFPAVTFPLTPERAPKEPGSAKGGFVVLPAPEPGLYQVTIDGKMWVDVVQDGAAVKSDSHSSDASCPAFHKSVRFALGASPVTLQFSGDGAEAITFTILLAE